MTTATDTPATTASRLRFLAPGAAAPLGAAFAASGRRLVAGYLDLGQAAVGIGREAFGEAGEHLRATLRAKGMRELAELQAAFAQRRFEMAATHAKELADIAGAGATEAIAPVARLLGNRSAG